MRVIALILICLALTGCASHYYDYRRNETTGEMELWRHIETTGRQHTIVESGKVDTDSKQEPWIDLKFQGVGS